MGRRSKGGERGRESRGREGREGGVEERGGRKGEGEGKGCVMAVGGWTPLKSITCQYLINVDSLNSEKEAV